MLLQADVDCVAGTPVIALTGRVDLSTVPTLQDVLARTVDASPGAVIAVDLDGVDGLDDVGLGVIVGSAGRARRAGGDVVLVCTRASLLERFALTRLDQAVTIVASLAEVAAATPDRPTPDQRGSRRSQVRSAAKPRSDSVGGPGGR